MGLIAFIIGLLIETLLFKIFVYYFEKSNSMVAKGEYLKGFRTTIENTENGQVETYQEFYENDMLSDFNYCRIGKSELFKCKSCGANCIQHRCEYCGTYKNAK